MTGKEKKQINQSFAVVLPIKDRANATKQTI